MGEHLPVAEVPGEDQQAGALGAAQQAFPGLAVGEANVARQGLGGERAEVADLGGGASEVAEAGAQDGAALDLAALWKGDAQVEERDPAILGVEPTGDLAEPRPETQSGAARQAAEGPQGQAKSE